MNERSTHKTRMVFIRTFGCQMNERDSEWIMGVLLEKGFKRTDSADNADVIIFNTCTVRKHAEDRAMNNMRQHAHLKRSKPNIVMGVVGCMAEHYGKSLLLNLPHLDFVCGTAKIHTIPDLVESILQIRRQEVATGTLNLHIPEKNPHHREGSDNAFVSISRGCDNYCSYCIVPYVRGPERSRDPGHITEELKDLLKRGFVNITLLGQNVNSYGKDLEGRIDFVKLLKTIDSLKGKKKISFMTCHPKDASQRLFDCMRDLPGLSKHLHLPLQSGSDKILKAMNRGYDIKAYRDKAKAFRDTVPNHRLTSDIVVGFPGELDKDFEDTMRVVKEMQFDSCYIFKYSSRPPAASSKMKDDVPQEVKERRHKELLELQRSISIKKRPK